MNPDSANQNQKAPRSVTNAGAARRVVKRNILCAGEIYTLRAAVSQVCGITCRNGTVKEASSNISSGSTPVITGDEKRNCARGGIGARLGHRAALDRGLQLGAVAGLRRDPIQLNPHDRSGRCYHPGSVDGGTELGKIRKIVLGSTAGKWGGGVPSPIPKPLFLTTVLFLIGLPPFSRPKVAIKARQTPGQTNLGHLV